MSIAATHRDGQQATMIDTNLDQLAQDMRRLHEAAHFVDNDDERQHFARLESTVNWRLNQLAYALAAHDTRHSHNPE